MVCTPRLIWGEMRELDYKRRATGERATFRDRKKARLSFATCGVTVAAYYLKANMKRIHSICIP